MSGNILLEFFYGANAMPLNPELEGEEAYKRGEQLSGNPYLGYTGKLPLWRRPWYYYLWAKGWKNAQLKAEQEAAQQQQEAERRRKAAQQQEADRRKAAQQQQEATQREKRDRESDLEPGR